jgi:hypothetical protein
LPLLFAIVIIPVANASWIAPKMNLQIGQREISQKIEFLATNTPYLAKSVVPIEVFETKITGYNTTKEQTDSTPCISASGENICGRKDVIACPRKYPFGSVFEIKGEKYVCEDRLAEKYDHRIDINCNLDFECSKQVFWAEVKVLSLGGK